LDGNAYNEGNYDNLDHPRFHHNYGNLSDNLTNKLLSLHPWVKTEPFLVAVSGGADSVALLHLLRELRPGPSPGLTVVHLDHGLRGAAARRDRAWVEKLAAELKLGCISDQADVSTRARRRKLSWEEAARQARFAFFRAAAERTGCDTVVLGHHRDDQVETILMRLLRGTAPAGLAGMRPRRRVEGLTLARPLLDFSRAQLEGYLRSRSLSWRQDATNRDTRFLRNRLRHELIPLLESEYNSGLRGILANLAHLEAEREDFIQAAVDEVWEEVAVKQGDEVLIDLSRLPCRSPVVADALIGRALAAVGVGETSRNHRARLRRLWEEGPAGACSLPQGFEARRSGRIFRLGPAETAVRPFSCELPCPGEVLVPEAGLLLTARVLDTPPAVGSLARCDLGEYWSRCPHLPVARAYFPLDRLVFPLVVRSRLPGDRLRPLGLRGSKKVKDLLIEAKVPRRRRGMVPILADGRRILWVVGARPAEAGRLDAGVGRVVEVCASAGLPEDAPPTQKNS